jgi:hypothetical protein
VLCLPWESAGTATSAIDQGAVLPAVSGATWETSKGPALSLQFLGGDTGDGGSPRLYQDGDDFLVQGYKVNETQLLAELDIPDGETVVRVPQSLWKYLPARQRENQPTQEGVEGTDARSPRP